MNEKQTIKNNLTTFLSTGGVVFSQSDSSELKLSLKRLRIMQFSIIKWLFLQDMEVEESKRAIWETISAALPQVNSSGSFTDNLKLMTTLLPGDFFGKPGEKVPVTFGSQFNSSASVQASLVAFQCSFIYRY